MYRIITNFINKIKNNDNTESQKTLQRQLWIQAAKVQILVLPLTSSDLD